MAEKITRKWSADPEAPVDIDFRSAPLFVDPEIAEKLAISAHNAFNPKGPSFATFHGSAPPVLVNAILAKMACPRVTFDSYPAYNLRFNKVLCFLRFEGTTTFVSPKSIAKQNILRLSLKNLDETSKLLLALRETQSVRTLSVLLPVYSEEIVNAMLALPDRVTRINVMNTMAGKHIEELGRKCRVDVWSWDADPAPHETWMHQFFRFIL